MSTVLPPTLVAVVESLQELRQRQSEREPTVGVDLELERLGLSTPSGHVDDAGNRAKPSLQDPVLQRLQVHDAVVRRSNELVAVDLADRAHRADLRLRAVGKRRKL